MEESDLFILAGMARHSALDALTNGAEMPFVLVEDRVVCTGGLDLASIAKALLVDQIE